MPHAGEAVFSRNCGTADSNLLDGNVGQGEQEGEVRVKADVIIAADGAGSKARQMLQKSVRCPFTSFLALP